MVSKETTNGSLHPEDSLVSCGLCVWEGEWEKEGGRGGEWEEEGGGEEERGRRGEGEDEIEIHNRSSGSHK